ncbi:MAG: universal stress protein [Pseudomonadota bacterium]
MAKSVLIPVDLDYPESWAEPFQAAKDRFCDAGADVHALYVLPRFTSSLVGSFFPKDFEGQALDAARTRLEDMVGATDAGALPQPKTQVLHGEVYREILLAAEKLKVDAILLLAHRPGLSDYLLGSNAARIARHARQSVYLLRG